MFQVSILTSCQSIKYVTVKNNGSFIFYYFEIILNNNEITSVGGKKILFQIIYSLHNLEIIIF